MEISKEGKQQTEGEVSFFLVLCVCFFCWAPLKSQIVFLKALGGIYLVPKNESKDPLSYSDKAGVMIFR